VDDDESLRRALARTIRLAGFEVETFPTVEALLARGLPDADACLVLDVDLPGISGIELKRTLVVARRDLPTVFITALAAEEVDEPLAALAPVAVLHKPFNKDDLLAAIGRARGAE
jgi:FixJ family two-component response regulator